MKIERIKAWAFWQLEKLRYKAGLYIDDTEVTNARQAYFALTPKGGECTVKHTVTFDTDGGSAVEPQQVDTGSLATDPIAPTKEGFTFEGWFREDSLQTAWVFESDTVENDITLYAKWEST